LLLEGDEGVVVLLPPRREFKIDDDILDRLAGYVDTVYPV
jgi:hypothetical protein